MTKERINEAIEVIQALGFPKAQQNERSALTLLALLNLKPTAKWAKAEAPLVGITPILEFADAHYGKKYAPNSRETFRRFTMHQFVEAGLAPYNPDKPRPINSPAAVYQIEPNALVVLQSYGTKGWKKKLREYLAAHETIVAKYAKERLMQQIPVITNSGKKLSLSPGDHSLLIKAVIEDFGSRFAPGGELIYAGDTGEKQGYFEKDRLMALGVAIDDHGKMPDVIIYLHDKNWLLLIEAVTSHGPMDSKRHNELKQMFARCNAGLLFVSAFATRAIMRPYLAVIAWETEVWTADAPSHLIHFNGERFLGPYV